MIETRPEPPRESYPHVVEQHGKMPSHASRPNWDGKSEEEDDWEEEDDGKNAL